MCHASSCDFLDTSLVTTQRSALVRKEDTLPNPRGHERKTPDVLASDPWTPQRWALPARLRAHAEYGSRSGNKVIAGNFYRELPRLVTDGFVVSVYSAVFSIRLTVSAVDHKACAMNRQLTSAA